MRMVEPNTERTKNISSTLRFMVLVAVSRWQFSGVCWYIVDTFCPESVPWHHFLEQCTLDIKHKNLSNLSKYPSCRSQGDVYNFNCAQTGYFVLHSESGCRMYTDHPSTIQYYCVQVDVHISVKLTHLLQCGGCRTETDSLLRYWRGSRWHTEDTDEQFPSVNC